MLKHFLAAALVLTSLSSHAGVLEEGDYFVLQTSLWSTHFDAEDHHNNHQRLASFELNKASRWNYGLAFFRNSFDQPSQYLYAGYKWALPGARDTAYFKLTGGLIHGYKGEHQDAIPFNSLGVAPALLPSIGARYKRINAELMLFGTAGMMLSFGVNFPVGGKQ